MTERRSHPRLLDCELVIICWTEGGENLQQLANADDVSLGGMRVRVDYAIPVGAEVTISYDSLFDGTLKGVVRYHLDRPEGVFLGIEFLGLSPETMLNEYSDLFSAA